MPTNPGKVQNWSQLCRLDASFSCCPCTVFAPVSSLAMPMKRRLKGVHITWPLYLHMQHRPCQNSCWIPVEGNSSQAFTLSLLRDPCVSGKLGLKVVPVTCEKAYHLYCRGIELIFNLNINSCVYILSLKVDLVYYVGLRCLKVRAAVNRFSSWKSIKLFFSLSNRIST